jgi:hypothetical protein
MPSYSTNLVTDTLQVNEILTPVETRNITCNGTIQAENITSTGVISWNAFDPPITGGGGTPGLQSVLAVNNTAATQDINNVGSLTFQKDPGDPESAIVGDSTDTTKCYHLDLSDSSNTFPSSIEGNLQATLALGNDAVNQSIQNLSGLTLTANAPITGNATNKAVITNCDFSSNSNVFPPSLNEDIEGTLIAGNDANGQSMVGLNALGAVGVQATTVSAAVVNASALTVNSSADPLSGELNLSVSANNEIVKLNFTGFSNAQSQDTEIQGDSSLKSGGGVKLTKCTYLDLTSSTNRIPDSDDDFVQGVYYAPSTQITVDFDDIDTIFHENCYWTFSTVDPSHTKWVVDMTFSILEYGYGDIVLSLKYQKFDGSNPITVYPGSEMLYVPEESATAFRSVRKVGQCHVQWVLSNLPTDGTAYKFWPACRTNLNDNGRMIIGMRVNGGNPDVANERGSPVIVTMRPLHPRIRIYEL